ncbi:Restriction enzyme BcgI beta subunit [Streptococcus oralis]|uniref:Restriction enzyme BcgI beta subunit n=1 Tax=Streptococcus oralis TaxID=1303 RepID=A0A139M836_STROR|nr:Restriction enzyme BcgI beta subunit [Streptococcus oralis]
MNRVEKTGLSVLKEVSFEDEWLAEAYMETDYSELSHSDFERNIKELFAFEVKYGSPNLSVESSNKKTLELNSSNWLPFTIKEIFGDVQPAKGETTDQLEEGSDLVYIAAKKENNGVKATVEYDSRYLSKGNSVVFINLGQGSAGYATYQPYDFIGMKGKISTGTFDKLNQYIGVFLVTILDKERFRYSFGRSWTGDRLLQTKIKLPVDANNNPDWIFMEEYIKSLPYGNMI